MNANRTAWSLRRGFKTEAEMLAAEVRSELGLSPIDAFDPWKLAAELEIPVLELSSLARDVPKAVKVLTGPRAGEFSAVTIFDVSRRMIIHNDSHTKERQRSNLCHELAHGLLNHPPVPPLSETGCRIWDLTTESEATWLSGALLVTPQAAVWFTRQGISVPESAVRLGVSQSMMRWRVNVTGASKRAGLRPVRL